MHIYKSVFYLKKNNHSKITSDVNILCNPKNAEAVITYLIFPCSVKSPSLCNIVVSNLKVEVPDLLWLFFIPSSHRTIILIAWIYLKYKLTQHCYCSKKLYISFEKEWRYVFNRCIVRKGKKKLFLFACVKITLNVLKRSHIPPPGNWQTNDLPKNWFFPLFKKCFSNTLAFRIHSKIMLTSLIHKVPKCKSYSIFSKSLYHLTFVLYFS